MVVGVLVVAMRVAAAFARADASYFKYAKLKKYPDKQPADQSEEDAAAVADELHKVMEAKAFLLEGSTSRQGGRTTRTLSGRRSGRGRRSCMRQPPPQLPLQHPQLQRRQHRHPRTPPQLLKRLRQHQGPRQRRATNTKRARRHLGTRARKLRNPAASLPNPIQRRSHRRTPRRT